MASVIFSEIQAQVQQSYTVVSALPAALVGVQHAEVAQHLADVALGC